MANKTLSPITEKAQARFWKKVQRRRSDECWPWLGALTSKGYGYCFPYGADGGQYRSHRVAFFIVTGVDPGELGGNHSCDNPPCCNPAHTIPSTQTMNLANMRAKGRGYQFPVITGENAPHAKLTDLQVAEIRRLAGTVDETGYWSERRLAARFKIANSQVHRILRGESRMVRATPKGRA
jgi:hypothetical protein